MLKLTLPLLTVFKLSVFRSAGSKPNSVGGAYNFLAVKTNITTMMLFL